MTRICASRPAFVIGAAIGLLGLACPASSHAALVQVSTLVPEDTFATDVSYDPGFGTLHASAALTTRQVVDAPVDILSDISGTSGASGGTAADGSDITLNVFSTSLRIKQLGRFGADTLSGGVRWAIDLSPLDGYLSSNTLDLSALQINLDMSFSDQNSEGDIYLSYTDAAQSITLTEFGVTSSEVATDWTNPAIAGGVGAIVGGSHEVVALDVNDSSNPHPETIDLLPLYNAGVRDVNLVIATEGFWGGGDNLSILLGSGVYIETVAVPEPATLGFLVTLTTGLAVRARR